MILPAIILAGGKASRMGGADKALCVLGGRPLLSHVITRLEPRCAPIAINANGDAARFDAFGLPVLSDSVPNQPGPLAGILAGMDWAASLGAPAVISAAADTPFFPLELAARLQQNAGPSGLCLAASGDGAQVFLQPTFGLWPVALRDDLRHALEGGLRKVRVWASHHKAGTARFDATDVDPFFNINTPEDLAKAERLLPSPGG
ncbi:molybdenum cofactor guanylyltransferase MobA [Pseudorhodobacter aquimaris]|uniref:molybdenum cofactor guanylyltransferase MobA n=1 Tax=Pseudorhodobacter aquimaris TaxID=687412 RepID=UPI00067D2FD4|nr:molybdenum cofactor guanylyltransferase MobA [Pseudorhodobacter aquimaris]